MSKNLTARFLALATIYFLISVVLGTLMLAGILAPTSALKAAHAHIALLGWVSATIIGTMYQQVPTLTATDLHSKKIAELSFWLFNIGVVGQFIAFIRNEHSSALVLTSSLIILAVILFVYNILMTARKRKGDVPVLKFYAASAAYFFLACVLGIGIAAKNPSLMGFNGNIIAAHAHLAVLGWTTLIIMGAMSWMFPMVVMRDIHRPNLLESVFWLFNIGTLGFFAGLLTQGLGTAAKIFGATVAISVTLFAYMMLATSRKEIKMKMALQSTETKFFKAALAYLVFASVLGVLMLFDKGGISGIKMIHVHTALIGFVSVTIMGGMYHVIPMICWTGAAGKRPAMGGKGPSSFKDLYSDTFATASFFLINAGVLGLTTGLLLDSAALEVAFAISITASGVIFACDMIRMMVKY